MKRWRHVKWGLLLGWMACTALPARAETGSYDLAVFGGTPAGVMAAVEAGKAGKKVVLLEPSYLVGGMMSGGLTKTDIGNRATVGGLSIEFFGRVRKYYEDKYGAASPQAKDCHGGQFFEPHVAEEVFSALLQEAGVEVRRKQLLDGVDSRNGTISSIRVRDAATGAASTVAARVFIDATYEGDVMALAGVPYRVGREARSEYGESLAGISSGPSAYIGKGDHRIQAYNIRSTLTTRDDIRVAVPKPRHYDADRYKGFVDSALRLQCHTFEDLFRDNVYWGMINGKCDPNKADCVGINYAYAEADYEARAAVLEKLQDAFLGLWWTLQNDPRLPDDFKESARHWGLPKDEFVESGHVSPQVYVREGRRMLGRYLLKQDDLELDRHKEDAICLGSYNIDSHAVQRLRDDGGRVFSEEGYLTSSVDPYEIPYRVLTPPGRGNLLVVCALSATHVAYGSVRMEPVFMMLGQAGGAAAVLALQGNLPVQDVPIDRLQARLKEAGIPLQAPYKPAAEISGAPESASVGQTVAFQARVLEGEKPLKYFWNFDGSGAVQSTDASPRYTFPLEKPYEVSLKVVDAAGVSSMVAQAVVRVGDNPVADVGVRAQEARLEGRWDRGGTAAPQNRHRVNFHDMNEGKGSKKAVFAADLPRAGRYLVAFAFQGGPDRATAVPVTVTTATGETVLKVNQRLGADPFAFSPLGEIRCHAGPARATVDTAGTDGFVSVDEIRWIWLGP